MLTRPARSSARVPAVTRARRVASSRRMCATHTHRAYGRARTWNPRTHRSISFSSLFFTPNPVPGSRHTRVSFWMWWRYKNKGCRNINLSWSVRHVLIGWKFVIFHFFFFFFILEGGMWQDVTATKNGPFHVSIYIVRAVVTVKVIKHAERMQFSLYDGAVYLYSVRVTIKCVEIENNISFVIYLLRC